LALIVDQGRIYRLLPRKRGPTVGCTASDAVYVALWLTTAGSGEIVAHSRLCGGLTVGNCPSDSRYSD